MKHRMKGFHQTLETADTGSLLEQGAREAQRIHDGTQEVIKKWLPNARIPRTKPPPRSAGFWSRDLLVVDFFSEHADIYSPDTKNLVHPPQFQMGCVQVIEIVRKVHPEMASVVETLRTLASLNPAMQGVSLVVEIKPDSEGRYPSWAYTL